MGGVPGGFLESMRELLGPAGVIEDTGEIEGYTTSFWRDRSGRAPLVLRPAATAEVQAIVRAAIRHKVPLVPQGGNTGLVGGGIPDGSGRMVVVSTARMDRIRGIDPHGDHLVAEAGCVLAEVQAMAAASKRLFPLSLGAEGSCRIGGNISTNAGGVNVLRWGMMRDLVLGLEVVLGDGTLWSGLRALRKDNRGYDLKQLFIGAEGTLGIITAATLKLVRPPTQRVTAWLGLYSIEAAVELYRHARDRLGDLATSFEAIAGEGVHIAQDQLDGVAAPLAGRHGWYVLVELGWGLKTGLEAVVLDWLQEAMDLGMVEDGTIAQSEAQRQAMWRIREGQSEAAAKLGAVWRSDVAVPVERIGELVDRAELALRPIVPDAVMFPFGHLGDGNLHVNLLLPGAARWDPELAQACQTALFDVVDRMGGSFSAEHGIGRSKRLELLARKDPAEIGLMRKLKAALDPHGILNPGAVI
jgi:FAD/FMN-containing dehydrogenase